MIRLGVIDSGVSSQWSSSAGATVGELCDFTGTHSLEDRLGHGSAVVDAVANEHAEIWMARVFDDRLACPVSRIVEALRWMLESNVQLINMSFGMTRPDEELATVVDQLLGLGVVLIAASPAQGKPVYPSAFDGVIRATGDARCQPNQLSFLNSPQADFGGFPGAPGVGPAGSSIGCAHVTRIACEALALLGDEPLIAAGIQGGLVSALKHRATWDGPERRVAP